MHQVPGCLLYLTAFLSAFLLFGLQPMIAKAILPWFGGAAGVWNCAQFFFQAVLLVGYLYAHLSISGRLGGRTAPGRRQSWIHLGLIAASLLFLPVFPAAHWKPGASDDPAVRVLLTLLCTVGLPYLVLSATSPLVSSWYARFFPGRSPYALFAWSNFGSFLGLLGYPLILEPSLGVRGQIWIWSIGYFLCLGLLAYLARAQVDAPFWPEGEAASKTSRELPALEVLLLWVGLPACSSVLLVALTHYITTEVAAVPLLWVIPLALYLLSYVIVASSWNLYRRAVCLPLFAVSIYGVVRLLDPVGLSSFQIVVFLWVCLAVLFTVLHGELWQQKPDPRHLSSFYLTMSTGGALGSFLVAYVFPKIFAANYELYLAVFLGPVLVLWSVLRVPLRSWDTPRIFGLLAVLLPASYFLGFELLNAAWKYDGHKVAAARNFYGTAFVGHYTRSVPTLALVNGRIDHGWQYSDEKLQSKPTGYYSIGSGIGQLFGWSQRQQPRLQAGLVGLGIGTLAAYARTSDDFTFYELDPKIAALAERYFTFLRKCLAPHRIVLGDARLSLENEPDGKYDILVIDAFTGDSIPVHLLTEQAFDTYARVLKPDGILAVHISNLYLNLPPVVEGQAQRLHRIGLMMSYDGEPGVFRLPSQWAILVPESKMARVPELEALGFQRMPESSSIHWTDNDSNLLRVIRPEFLP